MSSYVSLVNIFLKIFCLYTTTCLLILISILNAQGAVPPKLNYVHTSCKQKILFFLILPCMWSLLHVSFLSSLDKLRQLNGHWLWLPRTRGGPVSWRTPRGSINPLDENTFRFVTEKLDSLLPSLP